MREKREEVAAIAELLLLKETITHDDIVDAIGHRPFTVRDFLPSAFLALPSSFCSNFLPSPVSFHLFLSFLLLAQPDDQYSQFYSNARTFLLWSEYSCAAWREGAEVERNSGKRKPGD